MTNSELADVASLVACALHGMMVRRSASRVGDQVRWGLAKREEVRRAMVEWLEGTPAAPHVHSDRGGGLPTHLPVGIDLREQSLLGRVRSHLGVKSRRQNVLEEEMGLKAGALDGVLTEGNGFSVNAQGWVRVAEAVGAT